MISATLDPRLVARLAAVPGLRLKPGAPLDRLNTFRIGGAAELLVEVDTLPALESLLGELHRHARPLQILGLGSNVLIPDEGLPGVVARLAGEFRRIRFDRHRVSAGAAVSLGQLARRTAGQGLVGLEALSGFPSTVGGAVVMNAGCYGTEIKDLLETTVVVGRDGRRATLTIEQIEPAYRATLLQKTGEVVASAVFRLRPGDAVGALARIEELNRRRKATLPSGHPNVGSIFKNPPGAFAGKLIDECGLKGLREGGAEISLKHGNVIVNLGGARADEVLALMRRARAEVAARFGVTLEPEVVLAGGLRARWQAPEPAPVK